VCVSERKTLQENVAARLVELDVVATTGGSVNDALTSAIAKADTLVPRLTTLERTGESLSLRLAQSSSQALINELRKELEVLRQETANREKDIAARIRTGDEAQRVIEALRDAASEVVQERLREIGPLLQGIYARIDPHPAFRVVSFLSRVVYGKGRLATVVSDQLTGKECDRPAIVLSSSQINALAAAVFLAFNLGVPKPLLAVAMFDDPLQSLDDIHLLSLVDLLRRAKEQRQILVSTHDARFGSLLSRKLRPTSAASRTVVIELDGWSRQGPKVETREVMSDSVPLRLISAVG
jgi:hypothetical protein